MSDSPWWGDVTLADGEAWAWRIGATTVVATRRGPEWWLEVRAGRDSDDRTLAVGPTEPLGRATPTVHRYAGIPSDTLTLVPRLADRAVVVRPETPFHLVPGAEAVLFVSTVAWIAVKSGPTVLWEGPAVRPSDTWFGPDTRTGELCYATRTRARPNADALIGHPGRAVTAIAIENRSSGVALLERMLLPTRRLSVHTRDGQLWTDGVRAVRTEDALSDELHVQPLDGLALAPPREPSPPGPISRAFSALWSR